MVVGIIALLLGILLPSIVKARDAALVTLSKANLRNLGVAHASYSADFNDRQWTVARDDFGSYIGCAGYLANVGCPPMAVAGKAADGKIYGWGDLGCGGGSGSCINWGQLWPNQFPPSDTAQLGSYRYNNARSFNSYLNGRFYDPIFFAPKDRMVLEQVEFAFQDPNEFVSLPEAPAGFALAVYMSYVLSPAAMWSPDTFAPPSRGGFMLTLPGRFRSPPAGAAHYPELKTRLLEHHWLQNAAREINPAVTGNKTPYYFNHSPQSSPVTLFFDGHVGQVGVSQAIAADSQALAQSGEGLWSRDTPFGDGGYFGSIAYGDAPASGMHILTTSGIFGRDVTASE